jgi:hypothetical protein
VHELWFRSAFTTDVAALARATADFYRVPLFDEV